MKQNTFTRHEASARHRGASPWSFRARVAMLLWEASWTLTCAWTPKPLNPWRLLVLRGFGATLHGRPFVHPRARIQIPWNIELHDGASVGDRTHLYSIDRISVGADAVVAQEAYLCAGTHDFSDVAIPLVTAPIAIRARAFVGARAFVMPGVSVGAGAIIGACSVVTRDVGPGQRVAGNPARPIAG